MTYHLCSCFANWLNSPAIEEHGPVSLFQYPFLRLVVAGRLAVALFFIITGYVNSFNARKSIHIGDSSLVLSNISRNTLSRAARLVVPTNAAICMVWLLCQMNAFRVASLADSSWIRLSGASAPGPTFVAAIAGLLRNLIVFWHNGGSEYDHTYWTIPFFLKGSMLVYLTVSATTFTRPRYTKLILLFLYLFAWSGGQGESEHHIMILASANSRY